MKKNNSGAVFMLMIILIAVILAMVFIPIYNYQKTRSNFDDNNITIKTLTTNNWKEYRANNFSFLYPTRFTSIIGKDGNIDYSNSTKFSIQLVDEDTVVKGTDAPADNIVLGTRQLNDLTFEQYVQIEKHSFDNKSIDKEFSSEKAEEVKVGGQPAIMMQTNSNTFILYIPNTDNSSAVVMQITAANDFLQEYEKVINSFRFN